MSWIYTAAGHEVELRDPRPGQMVISDIAYHLSHINRLNGATSRPYCVAEHLLLVAEIAERELRMSIPGQLAALLHAAHLTWLSDISEPLQEALGDTWRRIEARFACQVRTCFGVTVASVTFRTEIRRADQMALATARRDLLPVGSRPWPGHEGANAVTWANLADPGRASSPPPIGGRRFSTGTPNSTSPETRRRPADWAAKGATDMRNHHPSQVNDTPPLTRGARPHLALRILAASKPIGQRELAALTGFSAAPEARRSFINKALRRLLDLQAARLTSRGAVCITDSGRELLAQLDEALPPAAPARYIGQPALPRDRSWGHEPWIATDSREPCMREGAFDFRKYPSRIGNTLVFREGHQVQAN